MKTLNTILPEELKAIFNASYRKREQVTQFGQVITNPNLRNAVAPDLIDTLDILIDLYDEAIEVWDLTAYNMHSLEGTNFEWLEVYEVSANNTYNWSSPLTNDLDFKVYKVNDDLFLQVAVHNGWSDARAGYMVEFLFKFDTNYSPDDWAVLMSDLPSYCKSFEIEDYYFSFDFLGESGVYNVSKFDGTNEVYDIYIGDYEDCIKWIEERKEEANV
jgi:hypothetical protein